MFWTAKIYHTQFVVKCISRVITTIYNYIIPISGLFNILKNLKVFRTYCVIELLRLLCEKQFTEYTRDNEHIYFVYGDVVAAAIADGAHRPAAADVGVRRRGQSVCSVGDSRQ